MTATVTHRRADVQGLRGIAVLLVIGLHAIWLPRGGYVGVDVFFVISGFVITTGLLDEAERTGTVSLRRFYLRRLQRIAPAALVTLVVVVAAAAVLLPAGRAATTAQSALWSAVGVGNWWVIASGAAYADTEAVVTPVVHFWSLAVEEQFYLVWPTVLLLAWWGARRVGGSPRRWVLGAAGVGIVASIVVAAVTTAADPKVAYYSTLPRVWELGVGVVLAAVAPHLVRLPGAVRSLLAVAGVAGIAAGAGPLPVMSGYPFPAALLPVAGAAAVIAAGTGGVSPLAATLGSRPMRWLGDRSYSLYLWHLPVLVIGLAVAPAGGIARVAVELVLCVLLAGLSYRFVEQPVLRWARGSAPTRFRSTTSPASPPRRRRSTPSPV